MSDVDAMQDTPHSKKTRHDLFRDELARTVLDSLSAHIAILDKNGVILATNAAWRNYAANNGMPENYDFSGTNYLGICDAVTGSDAQAAKKVAHGIRSVIRGELTEFLFDYPCHSEDGPHWYYMRAIRMTGGGPACVVASHEEITALKLTEEALRKSQEALMEQKQRLEETNIAMKVLLKQREEDRLELEKKVLNNVKGLVLPYIEKLKNAPLKTRQRALVDIVDRHLHDIISPLLQRFVHAKIMLTPQEMQVAALVKDGKTSKEIADILNVSETTIHFHRKNLRNKFDLRNKRTNLRSHLLSLSQP
jgi:DNA-binding CsgD family transcriptional regulator